MERTRIPVGAALLFALVALFGVGVPPRDAGSTSHSATATVEAMARPGGPDGVRPSKGTGKPAPDAGPTKRASSGAGAPALRAIHEALPERHPTRPGGCVPPVTTEPIVGAIVAIVPDPSITAMQLRFDRTVEALIAGFGDSGFLLANLWIPWKLDADGSVHVPTPDTGDHIDASPGVLVFRRTPTPPDGNPPADESSLVAVFLVPEKALYGLDRAIFAAALRLAFESTNERTDRGFQLAPWPAPRPPPTPAPRPGRMLTIIGPGFSSSIDPLWSVLSELEPERGSGADRLSLRIIPTTVTAPDLDSPGNQSAATATTVERITPAAVDQIELLRRFMLTTRWDDLTHSLDVQAGLLAETQTRYGAVVRSASERGHGDDSARPSWPQHIFRFPVDLATLRQASEASKTSLPETTSDARLSLGQGVAFDMRERTLIPQGLPTFSVHTPDSQAGVMSLIGQSVREHRLETVLLSGTNEMDLLFAARVVRSYSPDTRPVVFAADSIWTRWSNVVPLGGTLAVSAHPLVVAPASSPDAASPTFPAYLDSSSSYATWEGVRHALTDRVPGPRGGQPTYHTPWGACGTDGEAPAPLWLSVLSRGHFWPVALLSEFPDKASGRSAKGRQVGCSDDPTGRTSVASHRATASDVAASPANVLQAFPLSFWIVSLLASAFSLFHGLVAIFPSGWLRRNLGGRWIGWLAGALRPLNVNWFLLARAVAPRRAGFRSPLDPCRGIAIYQAIACLALAALSIVIATLAEHFLPFATSSSTWTWRTLTEVRPSPRETLVFLVSWLAAACCTMGAIRTTLHALRGLWSRAEPGASAAFVISVRSAFVLLAVVAWATAIGVTLTWRKMLVVPGGPWRTAFVVLRSVHLESGVSPWLVLAVLCVAIYAWAWMNGRRILMTAYRKPELPWPWDSYTDDQVAGIVARRSGLPARAARIRRLHDCIAHPLLEWRDMLIVTGGMALITICGSFAVPLTSLEGYRFDFLSVALYALVATFAIGAAVRAWRTWQYLRSLLIGLEGHPIRGAFEALPDGLKSAPLWGSPKSTATFVTERRAVELLLTFTDSAPKTLPGPPGRRPSPQRAFRALECMAAADDPLLDDRARAHFRVRAQGALRRFEIELDRHTCWLLAWVLDDAWRASSQDRPRRAGPVGAHAGGVPGPLVDVAEQFVAVRWLRFIRYHLQHVRIQLEYAATAFVATVAALNLYSYSGIGTIRIAVVAMSAAMLTFFAVVISQVDRDPILSRISGTTGNKLTSEFVLRIATFGLLPALTVLLSFFPSLARFFVFFGQPLPK